MIKNQSLGVSLMALTLVTACNVTDPDPNPEPGPLPENTAPIATSTPVLTADAGDTYWYQLTVSDEDGDEVAFSALSIPSWLTFSTVTGVLHGTPDISDAGEAKVVLGFTDGIDEAEQTFTILVNETYLLDPPPPPAAGPIVDPDNPATYTLTSFGAGNIADSINPAGYGCAYDYGHWIYNAGVVEPGVSSCDPIGTPTKRHPQLIGAITEQPVPTHKWWGSVSFHGEMTIGDPDSAAYITPDPITARISNAGVRIMGIPNGLGASNNGYLYQVPDPFNEVFDGIAVANSDYTDLDAYVYDHSDASVTVQWQDENKPVMRATFVHGSPYIFFKTFRGDIQIKTKAADGGEKGTYHAQGNSLGIWTSVAGNRNDFLITGEGETTFSDITSNVITLHNDSNDFTLTLLPSNNNQVPSEATIAFFEANARNVIASANVSYEVDRTTNSVTVTHTYLDALQQPITTVAGLHPLHWKNSTLTTSNHQVRSARGIVKFASTSEFSYTLPFVGVLPYLPSSLGTTDLATLQALVYQSIAEGTENWNDRTDTYWAGKNYGKYAELAAIADSIGMDEEAKTIVDWLKAELEDWFTADTNGSLDTTKYFVYDEEWSTLLGLEESFASHQQLNDHHFHYGYFVRAAAEICRQDASWCGEDQYGPMVELLIRDYAGSKNDDMFPYLRNFDPANGFSWASGNANFALGNNNESTSEAANAYGAIVLYGLITGNQDLVDKGMYLHASSTSAYWEYWNNIDRFRNAGADFDNFPTYYDKMTTSIIWGHGSVFATWFSPAFAHILGIQGLPTNPLNLHIGQYAEYMADYVELGLTESGNGKPSGLVDDMWRDIWWNLWAMTDADAAIADYNSMPAYDAEFGESKAHTYHWIHAWEQLGHLLTGTGAVTSNDPTAVAFDKNGVITYLAYNFSHQAKTISFSDGHTMTVSPLSMSVSLSTDDVANDNSAPSNPADLTATHIGKTNLSFNWTAATDDHRVAEYRVKLVNSSANVIAEKTVHFTQFAIQNLSPASTYTLSVKAVDAAGNESAWTSVEATTFDSDDDLPPLLSGNVSADNIGPIFATLSWLAAEEDGSVDHYTIDVTDGGSQNLTVDSVTTSVSFDTLTEGTNYTATVTAYDDALQSSNSITGTFTTTVNPFTVDCDLICVTEDSASSILINVTEPNVVIVHYKINGGDQLNVTMSSNGTSNEYGISGLTQADQINMSFTVIPLNGGAYDTAWSTYVFTQSY